MSNTPKATMAPIPEFDDPGVRKLTKDDRVRFRIGAEEYTLLRPKTALISQMAMAIDDGIPMDDTRNIRAILGFVGEIVNHIEQEPADDDGNLQGRARLMHRLNNPADALDLDNLMPIFTNLMDQWFSRPTGSPRASTPRRRATPAGRVSRARTPSTRART